VINDDNFGSGILSGTVSYYSTTGSEILLDSNLTKNPLATTCGGYAVDPQTAINNNGLVAFTGSSGNATALCTEQLGGAENVILSNPAGLIADFEGFDINIEGIVAFVLGFESFLDIYTGPSYEDIVVGVGATLPDGNLVTGVDFGGINDYCQMSFSVTFLTPGGAEGSAVWRANPSTCPVQCPPDIICPPASTMHPPHGNVLAAMGTDPSYLMPNGLLRTGWPLPFSEDGQLRMGDVSLGLIGNFYAASSGSVSSATNTATKIAKIGDIGQASCK